MSKHCKILTKNFSIQVDEVIKGIYPSGNFLILGETPKKLQESGIKNNIVIMKQSKLKNVLSSSMSDDRKHGLSTNLIKRIPKAIIYPIYIIESKTRSDSIVIITDLVNTKGEPIIVSMAINKPNQIGNIIFLSNQIKVYMKRINHKQCWEKQ